MTIGKKLDGYSSAAKAHTDELLDEALNETFPASDPVAINMERTSVAKRSREIPAVRGNPNGRYEDLHRVHDWSESAGCWHDGDTAIMIDVTKRFEEIRALKRRLRGSTAASVFA